MALDQLSASLIRRVTSKSGLLLVAVIGGILALFRALTGPTAPAVGELMLPFVLVFLHLALAPIPWQGSQGADGRLRLGRGLAASMLFNATWAAAFVAATVILMPPPISASASAPGTAAEPSGPIGPAMVAWLINVAFAIAFGWTLAEKEIVESKQQLTSGLLLQAQAKVLRNQLEPHVLFNALNDIAELVYEDPLAAEESLARLADLYRTLAVHGQDDIIVLGAERRLVEMYLAMEQMRLGERLRVEWEWPPWADAVRLPPLFLQPLVENAIKHGISPNDEGGQLRIRCGREEDAIVLAVQNTGLRLPRQFAEGIGIENLRARLGLWEGIKANFSLEQDGEWTRAEVRWWPREAA